MKQGSIFINYRKQDSEWKTETLYKELLHHFEADSIFKDFTTIEPGDDFRIVINQALNDCGVLLVIIGKEWLDIKDSSGKRRLDNSSDFVRFEIATALNRGIRVIPVLFDGIEMPLRDSLPEEIQEICNRHAISIDRVNIKYDVDRLAKVIKRSFKPMPDAVTPDPQPDPIPAPILPRRFSKINKLLIWVLCIIILLCLAYLISIPFHT